ncbi:AraC family transcriptional regulator [Dyadobacter sp. CY351]|uniref:helix-turn-helix domain-containing protein n=1 Tax=Dyadobacter sp. CY351 TaxID=2909337 RepID=UPI001F3B6572|nr:AraC family transcriptional regulator [Dyadobacter sp. CY351]MCF2518809.1 AraC family transcriptional regulator [Dyadobacter sp. CY351]
MNIETKDTLHSGAFLSCTEKKQLVFEQIVPEHLLVHVYVGRITVKTADKTYYISSGQTALFARNQLAKFEKEPDGQIPFNASTIFFTQNFLQAYYKDMTLEKRKKSGNPRVVYMQKHALLDDLFHSVSLYARHNEAFVPNELALLKVKEAVTVLRALDKNVDDLLLDFSRPHKTDLADFMQRNFMFNIPISRFAYLTGRSLATFKRDFQNTFGTSPQKWLTETRLKQAHFLIAEDRQKPSQVYLEVGFENFSHFSYAFRQHYGYRPSSILSL